MKPTYQGHGPYSTEKFERIPTDKVTADQNGLIVAFEACNSFHRCKCQQQCVWAIIPKQQTK